MSEIDQEKHNSPMVGARNWPLSIYPVKSRLALMVLITGLWSGLGVGLFVVSAIDWQPHSFFGLFGGLLSTFLCGPPLVASIKGLVSKKPAIRLDDEGIHFDLVPAALGVRFLPWQEIEEFYEYSVPVARGTTIGVRLKDTRDLLRRVSPFGRTIMRINLACGESAIPIGTKLLNLNGRSLLQILTRALLDHKGDRTRR